MNSVARVVSCVVVWLVACGEPPDTTNYSECERHEHCPRGGQVCCDNVCIDGTACDEAPVDFVADAARTCDVGLTGVDCNFLLPAHCESLLASMGGRVPSIEAKHLSVFPDGTVRVMIDGDLGLERSNEDSIWLTLTTSHMAASTSAIPPTGASSARRSTASMCTPTAATSEVTITRSPERSA